MNVFGFQIGSEDDPMTGEATAPSYFDEALGEFGSAAGAFAMHAGQGLTLNFGDELAAALMTPYEVLTSEDNRKDFWSRVGDAILFCAMSARSAMLADAMSARRARILPAVRGGAQPIHRKIKCNLLGYNSYNSQ